MLLNMTISLPSGNFQTGAQDISIFYLQCVCVSDDVSKNCCHFIDLNCIDQTSRKQSVLQSLHDDKRHYRILNSF